VATQLKRVNIIGRPATGNGRYAVVVKNRATEVVSERPITPQQYEALATSAGMAHLTEDGEDALYAYGDDLYDSPSGRLEDGSYAIESGSRALVKRDAHLLVVDSALIVGDVLTDEGELEVSKALAGANPPRADQFVKPPDGLFPPADKEA